MKTALLPISGKPLHLGHWRLIMIAAKECDEAIVFTSDTDRKRGKDEAEIKGTTAVKVWRSHFLPLMKKQADNVEVRFVDNPMQSVHELLAEEAKALNQTAPLFVIYSDDTDIDENWKPGELKKNYPKLSIQRRGVGRSQTDDVSGTEMRRWLKAGEAEKFMKHLPPVSAEDKKAIWNIYRTEDKMTRDPMKETFERKLREMMSNRVHELDNKKLYERVWRKVSLMDAKRFEALSKKIYGEKKTVKDVVDALHYSLTEKTDYVKPFDNDGFKAELEKFSEMIKDVDKEETKKAHEEIAAEIEKKGEENKEGVETKLDDKKKVNEALLTEKSRETIKKIKLIATAEADVFCKKLKRAGVLESQPDSNGVGFAQRKMIEIADRLHEIDIYKHSEPIDESKKPLKEGTWEFKYKEADDVIKMIEELKTKIYSLVGDDILFDYFDNAIKRVEEMKSDYETNPDRWKDKGAQLKS